MRIWVADSYILGNKSCNLIQYWYSSRRIKHEFKKNHHRFKYKQRDVHLITWEAAQAHNLWHSNGEVNSQEPAQIVAISTVKGCIHKFWHCILEGMGIKTRGCNLNNFHLAKQRCLNWCRRQHDAPCHRHRAGERRGSGGHVCRWWRAAAGSAQWLRAPAGFRPQWHGDAASERRAYEARTSGRLPRAAASCCRMVPNSMMMTLCNRYPWDRLRSVD